jgi:hypothetical protein
MCSSNRYPQSEPGYNELVHLIRRALKALNQQVAPERVWKQIKAELLERSSSLLSLL